MADMLDLVHRGNDLWARVEAREVKPSYARHVVGKTRHLSKEDAQYVATAVAKANPRLAREKELKAQQATFAKKCRDEAHGMTDDQLRVRAFLLLCHPGARPDVDLAELLPNVVMYVHTYKGADHVPSEGISRLEGHGPVTDTWVRNVLGPNCRFIIKPVIDIERPCIC